MINMIQATPHLEYKNLRKYTISFQGYEDYTNYTLETDTENIIKTARQNMNIHPYTKCENLQLFELDETDYYEEKVWTYDCYVSGVLEGGIIINREFGYLPYEPTEEDILMMVLDSYDLLSQCKNITINNFEVRKNRAGKWLLYPREERYVKKIQNTSPYASRREYERNKNKTKDIKKEEKTQRNFFSWLF